VARVIAFDLTEPMLDQAARLARERGLANVETRVGNAEALPYPDAQFDLVTCRIACHHFSRPEQAFAEMARVLRPGGTLGFVDNVVVADSEATRHYNAFEKLRDPSHHEVVSLGRTVARIEATGLKVDFAKRLEKEMEFGDWADRMRVSSADKKILLGMLREMPRALEPLLAPRFVDGTAYFTLWEAVVVARKPA
jgi:ubiquinone/menaquinone biosynthesis C-methylase UbiE